MDSTLSVATQLKLGGEAKNRTFIVNLATKIVDGYMLIPNAFLNKSVTESGWRLQLYTPTVSLWLTCDRVY